MENLFVLLTLASLILLIIGLFTPSTSLFWYTKEKTRKKSILIYGAAVVVSFISFGVVATAIPQTKTINSSQLKEKSTLEKIPELTQTQMDSLKLIEHESDRLAQIEINKANRKEEIEKLFSAWDGSARNLEKYIKQNMNDPDSYEHIETSYWDMKDHLVVLTKFRGKNGFGGKVVNTVKAELDLSGNVIKIIDQF